MESLRYGEGEIALPPPLREAEVVAGAEPPPLPDPDAAIAGALRRPLGAPSLATFVEPGDRVAVVVASAGELLLPPVLAVARQAGAAQVDVVAPGEPCEPLGKAPGLGTARIARAAARADRLLLLGLTSFDPLDCGGGILSRIADRPTAAALAAGGEAAIAELLRLAPPAFLVEIATQGLRRPAGVFAGDVEEAHRAAMRFHHRWHGRPLDAPADLAVVSAGGDPFDRDLASARLALEMGLRATRPGGAVILLAACPQGAGLDEEATRLLRARTAGRRCILVSTGLSPTAADSLGLLAARDLDEALMLSGSAGRVLLLPEGGRTLPIPAA